jgi:hypothetical protein
VAPEQIGPLLAATKVGLLLMVTTVVFVPLHPLESVTITV